MDKPLLHFAERPFVAACGADVPNQKTTCVRENVTCADCISKDLPLLRPGDRVVFDWTPAEKDRVHEGDDIADRYVVVARDVALSGIVVFANYRAEWEANPWSNRAIIRELLRRSGVDLGNAVPPNEVCENDTMSDANSVKG